MVAPIMSYRDLEVAALRLRRGWRGAPVLQAAFNQEPALFNGATRTGPYRDVNMNDPDEVTKVMNALTKLHEEQQ